MDVPTSPHLAPPTTPPWRVDETVEGWARPLGTLSIAFAVLGLGLSGFGVTFTAVFPTIGESGRWIHLSSHVGLTVLFITLAIAGVLTFQGRGVGRPWHLWSALLLLPFMVLAVTVPLPDTGSRPPWAPPPPTPPWWELAIATTVQLLIVCGYPIFLIVWFAPRRRSPDAPGALFRVRSRRIRIPR